jgi:transposase
MKITQEEFEKISGLLPVQRGNVSMTNIQLLNAILYVAEQGCKWRGLPESLGKRDTVYKRANRWAKSGVLDRVFEALQKKQIARLKIGHVSLGSTGIKVHPDAHGALGALKKTAGKASGKAAAGRTQRVVSASDTVAIDFSLSGGEAGGGPEGRKLLRQIGNREKKIYLIMDRAYEGDETCALAVALGYIPVVPPKSSRKDPREHDRELYKKRNEIERFFRRYKRFRRVCTRYDKLDGMFLMFFTFALIFDALL